MPVEGEVYPQGLGVWAQRTAELEMVALGGLAEVAVRDPVERWTSLLIASAVSVGLPAPVGLAERGYRSVSIGSVKVTVASDQPSPGQARLTRSGSTSAAAPRRLNGATLSIAVAAGLI
jgi:hypothetical protein